MKLTQLLIGQPLGFANQKGYFKSTKPRTEMFLRMDVEYGRSYLPLQFYVEVSQLPLNLFDKFRLRSCQQRDAISDKPGNTGLPRAGS